ncbi:MAG: Gldg family protein, partial [Chthoniobacterales bacterium]
MSSRPSRLHVVVRIVLQIFSALCLLLAMNYVAFHYYRKVDCSRSHRFSLSDQGSVLFAGIRQPAHIIIYFSPTSLIEGTELYGDVEALMNEYQIKAREHLVVEYLDPIRELGRAREVQGKYKFNPNENVIVIDYLDHSTVIPMRELGEYDVTGTVSGGSPQLIAFRGEQVINAALISLSGVPLKKIYFLQGHGEFIPGESPLEIIGRYLKYQNIIPTDLNLANRMEVPNDAALLVIDGARVDFSETEIEVLKNYWKQSGRFFVLLDPTADTPRFCQMLTEIGITPRADRVIRTLPGKNPSTIVRDVVGDFVPGSELTKQFLRLNILFLGTTQSLVLKNSDNEIQLRPLVQASYGFYRSDIRLLSKLA